MYKKIKKLTLFIILFLYGKQTFSIEFNTDVLDAHDRKNIDISRFSEAGYVMPGRYLLDINVNGQAISPTNLEVSFIEREISKSNSDRTLLSEPCLTSKIVNLIGLTQESVKKVTYWKEGQCANFSQLPGVEIKPETSRGILNINIPQAWMEYSDASWLPPSRWDDGIPGIIFDYNITGTINNFHKNEQSKYLSYNGTAGANLGAWRLRADYQGNDYNSGQRSHVNYNQFSWSRLYLFRPIPEWRANFTLGENNISSDIFNTWSYAGATLESDDRMLPPKLRGYAPQVSGVADTNARVIIRQQGRILYNSTVPAGPFTIRDLDSSIRGRLDVEIIEQNGQKKTFQIDTASVPYLTRPGQVRFKIAAGRSRYYGHNLEGPVFTTGEASWGISNKWSLYGGGIFAGDYNAISVGLGHDLGKLGTISSDITQSIASLPQKEKQQGKSWRISYSKRFDEANTDITFAGYRFSERNYLTMQRYLDERYRNSNSGLEKELYTVSVNKNIDNWKMSAGVQYSHQVYWDQQSSDFYTISISRYLNAFGFRNISANLTANRTLYKSIYDNTIFFRLSVPWGTGNAGYSGTLSGKRFTHTVGYSDTINDGLSSYSINVGVSNGNHDSTQNRMSAYYSHNSALASWSANISTVENEYTSIGLTASGGATFTTAGAALHAGGMNGGTRLLVDTDGIADVPVDNGRVFTNRWGIGVVTNVSSYYRNTTSVDLTKLPDDMEATRSVVESILTEGAIGYRKFEVLKGSRLFAFLRLTDSSVPPFGASVINEKGRELGMVADQGLAWLSGVSPGDTLRVDWNGKTQCVVNIPDEIKNQQQLFLPCRLAK